MKIPAIQYLRAIAAIAVVLDHAATLTALDKYYGIRTPSHEFLLAGALGVNLFFLISGFIIVVSSLAPRTLQARKSFLIFIVARFVRIVPMMWLAIISYAVLRLIGRSAGFDIHPYLNAFLLLPYGEYAPNNIWTLRHELLFYLVFGLSFLLIGKPKFTAWIFVVWILLSILLSLIGWYPNYSDRWHESLSNIFFPGNLLFGAGVLIGAYYLRNPKQFEQPVSEAPIFLQKWWILAGAFSFTLYLGTIAGANTKDLFVILCTLPIYAGLVFLACYKPQSFSKKMYFLGNASFSIYLFHPHVESALLGIMSRHAPSLPSYSVILIVTTIAICVGCVIYRYVEMPVTGYLHKIFKL